MRTPSQPTPWQPRGIAGLLLGCAVSLAAMAQGTSADAAPALPSEVVKQQLRVLKLSTRHHPLPAHDRSARVDRLGIDAHGNLSWDERELAPAQSPCRAPSDEVARHALWTQPRIDLVQCAADAAQGHRGTRYLMLVPEDRATQGWVQPLAFVSGPHRIQLFVAGVDARAILLSNGSIVSPATGEIVQAGPTDLVRDGDTARAIPRLRLGRATALAAGGFLHDESDVTLLKQEGGLYFVDGQTGRRTLWVPVQHTYRAPWRLVEAASEPSGRFVYLAFVHSFRGPGRAAVAVLDVRRRAIVYEERLGNANVQCREPQLVRGEGLDFAFACLQADASQRGWATVLYRVVDTSARVTR